MDESALDVCEGSLPRAALPYPERPRAKLKNSAVLTTDHHLTTRSPGCAYQLPPSPDSLQLPCSGAALIDVAVQRTASSSTATTGASTVCGAPVAGYLAPKLRSVVVVQRMDTLGDPPATQPSR